MKNIYLILKKANKKTINKFNIHKNLKRMKEQNVVNIK